MDRPSQPAHCPDCASSQRPFDAEVLDALFTVVDDGEIGSFEELHVGFDFTYRQLWQAGLVKVRIVPTEKGSRYAAAVKQARAVLANEQAVLDAEPEDAPGRFQGEF